MFLGVGSSLLAAALVSSAGAQASNLAPIEQAAVAFIDVTVIPMDSQRILRGQTVLVRQGRIVEIGPAERVRVPGNTLSIDGRGGYLMPGVVDMHVHLRDYAEADMAALLQLYVAAG